MTDNPNPILAVVRPGLVVLGWQIFYNGPQMEKQRAAQQAQSEMAKRAAPATTTPSTSPQTGVAPAPAANAPAATQPASAVSVVTREAALAAGPRIKIDTPRLS